MIAECMVFGAGAALAYDAVIIEYLKSKQLELSEAEKKEFSQDKSRRFVHFTSKESAEQIMQSGFLIPTKGVLDNHFTKSIDGKGKKKDSDMVYMFDSATFSVDDYIRNLPKNRSPFNGCYEYYAVSTRPDEYEINNFKRRAQDGAITYEGRLDIDGTDTKLVKYVLGLDEQGEYKLDEVPMDFEYTPSQELLDKLSQDKMGMLKYTFTAYKSEVKRARTSLKKYRAQKELYKEQIRKKKEFAKANRQFVAEQKDKNYIFEKDGKTIVVKNVEYEQVGGKKLQKLAIIENSEDTKKKKLAEATKFCYMDEFNIEDMDRRVATEYFFGNLDKIKDKQSMVPEYIGLPTEDQETGEVTNEYDTTFDTTFKDYMDKRQARIDRVQVKYEELQKSRKWTHKIKAMFSKVFARKKDVKMLGASKEQQSYEAEDRDALAKLSSSPVEAMNIEEKEAEMFSFLHENTCQSQEVIAYDKSYEEKQIVEGQDITLEQ